MEIKKDQEEIIINFGAFDYDSTKISIILDINIQIIERELKNSDSKLNKLLRKGKEMYEYVIDLKLFEMAKAGDINALEKLEARKWQRNI